jgi:hypothetical protein
VLGNANAGVAIGSGASGNTIGGSTFTPENIIANNGIASGAPGVIVGLNPIDVTTVGNAVLGNAIYANGGPTSLGIDLGDNGPTSNGSGPNGPNHFQNYPVPLTSTLVSGPTVDLTFTFSSLPNSTFRLEFYLNNAGDTAQGRTFLGSVNATTDGTGAVSSVPGGSIAGGVVSVAFLAPPGVTPSAGQLLTGTAILLTTPGTTGTPGDTSEFSTPAVTLAAGGT